MNGAIIVKFTFVILAFKTMEYSEKRGVEHVQNHEKWHHDSENHHADREDH